jgi:hypothetical protein
MLSRLAYRQSWEKTTMVKNTIVFIFLLLPFQSWAKPFQSCAKSFFGSDRQDF